MAGAVGAVLELISCVYTVLLPITHKTKGHTAWMTRLPDCAGELVGTALTVAWRAEKEDEVLKTMWNQ